MGIKRLRLGAGFYFCFARGSVVPTLEGVARMGEDISRECVALKDISFINSRGCRIVGIESDVMVRKMPLDGITCKGSFVVDSTAIRKSYTRVDGKGLVFGNSDLRPIGDFGVAAQGKVVAYQFGVFLQEAAGIVLRAVDKEAGRVVEIAAYAAFCTFATDGDNEDIAIFIKPERANLSGSRSP